MFLPGTNKDGVDIPNKTLLSSGGDDLCIMQWSVTEVPEDKEAVNYEGKQTDGNVETEMMYPVETVNDTTSSVNTIAVSEGKEGKS